MKFYIPQTGRQEKEGERDVWEKIEAKYEDELTKWRKAGTELFAERGRVPASFEVFSQAARARPSKDVQVAGGRRCSRQVRGLLRERSLSVYKETRARCGESGALRAPTSPPPHHPTSPSVSSIYYRFLANHATNSIVNHARIPLSPATSYRGIFIN